MNDEIIKLGELKENGQLDISWREIGRKFGLTRDQVRKRYYRHKDAKRTKILAISDLHIPFHRPDILGLVAPFENKVDVLVFNGDEQDCQSISVFKKKFRIPFADELVTTRTLITKIVKLINPKKVVFINGNHNHRLINYLSDRLHDDILQIMPDTNLDLIIDEGFYKKDKQENIKIYYEPLIDVLDDMEIIYDGSWYYQIGKTIFAHPKAYRQGILSTTEKAVRYFQDNGFDFNSIVLAHTHNIGFSVQGNILMYEQGCLCQTPGYATDGKLMRVQQNGMIYVVQDENGELIYEDTKLILLRG